jgi:hypothetical protein
MEGKVIMRKEGRMRVREAEGNTERMAERTEGTEEKVVRQ